MQLLNRKIKTLSLSKNIALSFASLSLLSLGIGESTNANLKKNFKDLESCSYETAEYQMKYETDVFLFGENREKGQFRYCITKNKGIVEYSYSPNIDGFVKRQSFKGFLKAEDIFYEGGYRKKVQWDIEENALVRYSCNTYNDGCNRDVKRFVAGYKRNAFITFGQRTSSRLINSGIKDGKLTYFYDNGDKYVGDWRNGKANGKGTFTWANGDKYVGDWVNGNRTGKGTFNWVGGNKYVGDFLDNMPNGKGTLTFPNGYKYKGDWVDNNRSGFAIVTLLNGDKYEGNFLNDIASGKGTLTWANGNKYVGDWVDGYRTGKGTLTTPSGMRYVGNFVNNMQTKGTLYYPNGDKYVGEFVDGNFHGKGTITLRNGKKIKGKWLNGNLVN